MVSLSTTNFDGKPRSNTYTKACENNCFFFLSNSLSSTLIPEKSSTTHIKPHIDYASVVWDGYGEVHQKTELPTSNGRQINPSRCFPIYRAKDEGPSLFTEQTMSARRILNLLQQLTYNEGVFVHKILNNNSPSYLAQVCMNHQPHCTNYKNNLYVPRPRFDLFKTSISFTAASLWKSLPPNIKSCISLPCFKCYRHKYMSENNLSSNLGGFVWITCLPKHLSVVYMYIHERNLIPMFLHICRNSVKLH